MKKKNSNYKIKENLPSKALDDLLIQEAKKFFEGAFGDIDPLPSPGEEDELDADPLAPEEEVAMQYSNPSYEEDLSGRDYMQENPPVDDDVQYVTLPNGKEVPIASDEHLNYFEEMLSNLTFLRDGEPRSSGARRDYSYGVTRLRNTMKKVQKQAENMKSKLSAQNSTDDMMLLDDGKDQNDELEGPNGKGEEEEDFFRSPVEGGEK